MTSHDTDADIPKLRHGSLGVIKRQARSLKQVRPSGRFLDHRGHFGLANIFSARGRQPDRPQRDAGRGSSQPAQRGDAKGGAVIPDTSFRNERTKLDKTGKSEWAKLPREEARNGSYCHHHRS